MSTTAFKIGLRPQTPTARRCIDMVSDDTICKEFAAKLGRGADKPEYFYTCGLVHAMAGSTRDAESAYKKAIGCKPDYWEAHFSLAMLYADQKLYGDAIDHLRIALDSNPRSARISREIVRTLLLNGDKEVSVSVFRDILTGNRYDHVSDILHDGLGRACFAAGKYAEAAAAYREALAQKPGDPHFYLNLGKSLLAQGKLDEAADAFESALRIRPDLPSASIVLTALRSGAAPRTDTSAPAGEADDAT